MVAESLNLSVSMYLGKEKFRCFAKFWMVISWWEISENSKVLWLWNFLKICEKVFFVVVQEEVSKCI